jgi:hypothetical protein
MEDQAVLLWPEREDLYGLMCLRATIGAAAFASEKQGDPFDPAACEWPPAYFAGPGFWFEAWPKNLALKTLALDPSKGKDAEVGDYAALVRLGIDNNQVMYVEADLQWLPTPQIVANSVDMVRRFQPDGFVVEINLFQELLVAGLLRVGEKQKIHLPIFEVPNQVNKEVRIRRLGTYIWRSESFASRTDRPEQLCWCSRCKTSPWAITMTGPTHSRWPCAS